MANPQVWVVCNNASSAGPLPFIWPGGSGLLAAQGGFGGGTLQPQISIDGATWLNLGSSLSSAGTLAFTPPPGVPFRVLQSGATTPTVLAYAYVTPTATLVV